MIVIDVETGGLIPSRNPLLSIGAVDFLSGDEFYVECRLDHDQYIIEPAALNVNGFTMESLHDSHRVFPATAYAKFVSWVAGHYSDKPVLAGQQVGSFDILFLHEAAGGKIAFEQVFSKRSVDLHSVAFAVYGKSLSLDGVLNELGLDAEPKPHNALVGARLEAECFRHLLGSKCRCRV